MTDEQTAQLESDRAADPPVVSGIGKAIVQTFRNSVERMKNDKPPVEDVPLVETAVALPVEMVAPKIEDVPEPARPLKPEKVERRRPTVTTAPATSRQIRRARLRISRIDPWSVMKTSLLFGVAGWIIMIVATWAVFTVLNMTGLYEAINSTVAQVFASPDSVNTFNIKDYVNTTRATALAALVGAVNVIILTALATIFAFLYNLSATVMGGLEVTMAED